MIDSKIEEQLEKYDFVVIPCKQVIGCWQTKLGDLKMTVVPSKEDGEVCRFMNHDSIHLI